MVDWKTELKMPDGAPVKDLRAAPADELEHESWIARARADGLMPAPVASGLRALAAEDDPGASALLQFIRTRLALFVPLTLGAAAVNALIAPGQKAEPGDKQLARWTLAMRVQDALAGKPGTPFTVDDLKEIKDRIAAHYHSPAVTGQAFMLIEAGHAAAAPGESEPAARNTRKK